MPWDHHVPESILIHARTLAFMTLVFTQMLFVLSIQHEYDSFFLRATWSNLWLIGAVIFALLLQFVILFTPFLRDIFHLSPLSLHDWDIVLLLAGVPLVVNEIRKYAIRKQKRRENIL